MSESISHDDLRTAVLEYPHGCVEQKREFLKSLGISTTERPEGRRMEEPAHARQGQIVITFPNANEPKYRPSMNFYLKQIQEVVLEHLVESAYAHPEEVDFEYREEPFEEGEWVDVQSTDEEQRAAEYRITRLTLDGRPQPLWLLRTEEKVEEIGQAFERAFFGTDGREVQKHYKIEAKVTR